MDFLSQIPMALLRRPTTGVLDFAGGAIGGLSSGDSGSLKPGILSSLGRLGMMAMAVKQSKDPTALLRVKSYFDAQDAQKRDALSDPMAKNLTPEEFQSKFGFYAPGSPKVIDMGGGETQTVNTVNTLPTNPGEMLKYQGQQSRLDRAAQATDPFEASRIIETGMGPSELTQNSMKLRDQVIDVDPTFDERTHFFNYSPTPDGGLVAGIRQRPEGLLNEDDLAGAEEWLASQGLTGKIAGIPRFAGTTLGGKGLFRWTPMSIAQEREGRILSPTDDYYQHALKVTGGDRLAAAKMLAEYGDVLKPEKDGKESYGKQWLKAEGIEYDVEVDNELTMLNKEVYKPRDVMKEKLNRAQGVLPVVERMENLKTQLRARKNQAQAPQENMVEVPPGYEPEVSTPVEAPKVPQPQATPQGGRAQTAPRPEQTRAAPTTKTTTPVTYGSLRGQEKEAARALDAQVEARGLGSAVDKMIDFLMKQPKMNGAEKFRFAEEVVKNSNLSPEQKKAALAKFRVFLREKVK